MNKSLYIFNYFCQERKGWPLINFNWANPNPTCYNCLMEKFPKVGVAIILVKDGKVLMGKRIGSHGAQTWSFPGGHLEFGESLENCAKREVKEETSLAIPGIIYGTFTNDIFKNEGKHYITLYVIATDFQGEPKILEPDRCLGWQWFAWDKLPQPLFLCIENLLKQKFDPRKFVDNS